MMRRFVISTLVGLAAVSAEAQLEFQGTIATNNAVLALAADGSGGLYYTTVDGASSSAYYIADPSAAIGTVGPEGVQMFTTSDFPAGRGIQGIQVDAAGNVYVSGDTGASPAWIKKYGPAPSFTEDTTFGTNTAANANRQGGCVLVGANLLATSTFNSINYFSVADGTSTGLTNIGGGTNFQREPVYNATDSVIYAFANGGNSALMLKGSYTGVSETTGGGAFGASPTIADGADAASAFGTATAHGFFDATSQQLYSVDNTANLGGTPQVRIWDVTGGGTTLTLADSFDGTLGPSAPGWANASDVVLIGTTVYVSVGNDDAIHVYAPAGSAVSDWQSFE